MKNICIAIYNQQTMDTKNKWNTIIRILYIVLQHQDGPGIYSLFRPNF